MHRPLMRAGIDHPPFGTPKNIEFREFRTPARGLKPYAIYHHQRGSLSAAIKRWEGGKRIVGWAPAHQDGTHADIAGGSPPYDSNIPAVSE
jgi:hypothetical protein